MVVAIFSSKYLGKYLSENFKEDQTEYVLSLESEKFSIQRGSSIRAELPSRYADSYFEFEVSFIQVRKLIELCNLLEEQPLGLGFDRDHNWIWVKEAII